MKKRQSQKKSEAAAGPRRFISKIKTPQGLKRVLSKRGTRAQVVFTNGCFDLLHKGHVTYLEQARRQGSLLVVALNSDESVSRLKGPQRPLNRLSDRLEVMAALESVDYVTWFEEDTPLRLIELLRPDVLVKGGDWKVDQIVGGKEVLGCGGKVKSLPYQEGHSTTRLIEKARSRS